MKKVASRLIAVIGAACASLAQAEQPVTTFTLDNGLEVVVIEDHRAPVVTHMVWYRVGSADEPWGTSGIAHFFEHYKDLEKNKWVKVTGWGGSEEAAKAIEEAIKRAEASKAA